MSGLFVIAALILWEPSVPQNQHSSSREKGGTSSFKAIERNEIVLPYHIIYKNRFQVYSRLQDNIIKTFRRQYKGQEVHNIKKR